MERKLCPRPGRAERHQGKRPGSLAAAKDPVHQIARGQPGECPRRRPLDRAQRAAAQEGEGYRRKRGGVDECTAVARERTPAGHRVNREQRAHRGTAPRANTYVMYGGDRREAEAKLGEGEYSAVGGAAERPKCKVRQSQAGGGRRKYPGEPAGRRELVKRERQRQHRRSVDKGERKAREPIARDAQFRG